MGIIFYVDWLFRAYGFLMLIRVLLSWLPAENQRNPVVDLLVKVTEPVMGPCRYLLNAALSAVGVDVRRMPIDFSPILAYLVVDRLIRLAVVKLLIMLLM